MLLCPPGYCKLGTKNIKLDKNSSAQCAFNHAGVLCGGCIHNYSMAIGSTKCIRCDNRHTALVLVFAVAGLVIVLFILAVNLTITEGLINSLIFYANIIQTYKQILPSPDKPSQFESMLHVFIAWFNLDFGIETCLGIHLNMYWKTYLQFLSPLYLWTIAGAIIFLCRHSVHITRLVGNRAVPLLATLFLLSYMKLL